MRHFVSISLVLAVLWLINSGHYTPLILCFGFLSVLLVVFLSRSMNIIDEESQPFHLGKRLPAYYAWLLWQIVMSSVQVSLLAWRGGKAVSPRLRELPISQRTELGKVIYANSLTLTPGTIAIDLKDDVVLVHSLTGASMEDLERGNMNRRVTHLEDL